MNISDWTLSGGGMEGESYFSASHPGLIMKVYLNDRPMSFLEKEFRQIQELRKLGISVPECYEILEYNGHPAIINQRIKPKKSFARLSGERPDLIPELAQRMANMIKDLHSKSVSAGVFSGTLDKFRQMLESNTVLDSSAKARVAQAMDAIAGEERMTLLHGDFHFGNIITDGARDYFIDMGDVSYGNPNHDLAMFYITTHYGCNHSFAFLYHMSWQQSMDFWNEFKRCYYGFDIPDAEVFEQLRNYMYARSVWFKHDEIQAKLYSILQRKSDFLTTEIRLKVLGE